MLIRLTQLITGKFPYVIGVYFLLQICIRLLTTSGVVIDESEQVMLTQYFALGYNVQPPLYTWLQMLFFGVFGQNVFAISLLKNIVLFLIYVFIYLTAFKLTKDKVKAALCGVGLTFLPQIVWEAQIDQIHTVLLTASAAALWYFYFVAWEKQRSVDYVAMGLVAACGVLAKYNYVVVLFAVVVATFLVPDYRRRMLNRKVWLTIAVFAVCVAPHAVWFLGNIDLATGETLSRMSVDSSGGFFSDVAMGMLDLVVASIAFVAVFATFYFVLFRKGFQPRLTPLSRLLILYIALTLVSVIAVIMLTQATNIKERWLQPFLFLVPLLMFVFTDLRLVGEKNLQIFTLLGIIFCTIVMLVIPLRVPFVDLVSKPHRENYPFAPLVQEIEQAGLKRGLILAEDKFIGGNIRLFCPDATVITPSIPLQNYKRPDQVLVVWGKTNPISYLGNTGVSAKGEAVQFDVPFLHSKKFTATFFAQIYALQ